MGGSMGSVVGEKVTRAAEDALDERLPLIVVSASGGARMQEGTLALMQLVRTVAALARLADAGVPYISLMTDPTTGGVFASFSALGDVNIAEPGALIGFAGSRVAAGTTGDALPEGFQRAEFLFRHGFVDRVVPAPSCAPSSSACCATCGRPTPGVFPVAEAMVAEVGDGPWEVPARADRQHQRTGCSPWLRARTATPTSARAPFDGAAPGRRRDPGSASGRASSWPATCVGRTPWSCSALMAEDVIELHGDRLFGDDAALVGGFATLAGQRIVFVGHQKGGEVDENIRRNFGMPHPEGYRKAMRLMRLAERLGLPIVTFVDTPGASPDAASEERGQAEAIASSIALMTRLRMPIVTVITGEGGSGGALAIAVGDVVLALENAIYSVISPEGCASILWRTPDAAQQAAVAMRLTAADQLALGVVDEVVPEPADGAHEDAGADRQGAARGPRAAPGAARGTRPGRPGRVRATVATARSAASSCVGPAPRPARPAGCR